MSDRINLELHNRQQALAIIKERLYPYLGAMLQADKRLVLTVGPRKRTPAQNRRYWGRGVLAQIAEQAAPGGKLYRAETWHELAKRKFIGVIELPDGSIQGESSTGLSTAEFCEFCDKVEAWGASELGVTFYDLPEH